MSTNRRLRESADRQSIVGTVKEHLFRAGPALVSWCVTDDDGCAALDMELLKHVGKRVEITVRVLED